MVSVLASSVVEHERIYIAYIYNACTCGEDLCKSVKLVSDPVVIINKISLNFNQNQRCLHKMMNSNIFLSYWYNEQVANLSSFKQSTGWSKAQNYV